MKPNSSKQKCINKLGMCLALCIACAFVLFSDRAGAYGEVIGSVTGAEYTEVADAFDEDFDDVFDIYIKVGYERSLRKWMIRRENARSKDIKDSDWVGYDDYASAYQIQDLLNLEVDVGLYMDLQFVIRIPLILNDQRGLRNLGPKNPWNAYNQPGLFSIPFTSPDRSGIDYFAVGLDWAPLNQERDDTKPTWVISAEGRFGVGEEMKPACSSKMVATGACPSGTSTGGGGVGRGLNEVYIGTRIARRMGIFNPFVGLGTLLGFAKKGTAYHVDKGTNWGAINTMPPIQGQLDFGIEFVPWEVPEDYRKFSLGILLNTTYHSEGREYTPLFDALGTSDSKAIVGGDYDDNGKVEDWEREYSGMTDVENYTTFHGTLFFNIQVAEYIKFLLDLGFGHEQEHFITKTDQCDEDNQLKGGGCSHPNHDFRPSIDAVGQRFRAEAGTIFDFSITAVAMF